MSEPRSEKGPPTESISSVVGWAASGGLCPHWCKDTRTGPHWHDFVESLEAAGYKVAVAPAESGSSKADQ